MEYDRLGEVLELSHILFRLPGKTLSRDTLAVYEKAMKVYERIKNGEDMATVGQELAKPVSYTHLQNYCMCRLLSWMLRY